MTAAVDERPSDTDFPPLGPASQAPSRQQSISLTGTRKSTPDVPPGFEHISQSGRATPTVPPGLEGLGKPPTAVPADVKEDVAAGASAMGGASGGGTISRPGSRAAVKRQITPVLPLRPATPRREGSAVGKGVERGVENETPTKKPAEAKKPSTVGVEEVRAKAKGKEPVKEVKEDAIAAQDESAAMPVKVEEEGTATPSKTEKKAEPTAPKDAPPTEESEAKNAPVTPSKPDTSKGRKHPGKLDITAAVEKTPENAPAQAKAGTADVPTPTTAAQTPSKVDFPSMASPAVKNAPRTLRLVHTPTPKAETPPVIPAAAPVEKPKDAVPAAVRAPSRQPSVASIQNLPGTPSSEQVSMSDNISMTSTSQSRANSPPPSGRSVEAGGPASKIVGSAPMRQKTKAQAKKDRQERAKQMEEERVKAEAEASATAKIEEEAAQQEAIVSRKKKAKKEKPAPAPKPMVKGKEKDDNKTAEKTPISSRAPSPSAKAEKSTTPSTKASKPSTPTRTPIIHPPHHQQRQQQHEPSPPPTPTLTAAQIIAELKATAPEIQKSIDALLRASPTGTTAFKPAQPITAKDLANPAASWRSDLRFQLSKEDVDGLLKGTLPAKRFGGKEGRQWDRALVSPSGATLRCLTEELERRFLELEGWVRGMGTGDGEGATGGTGGRSGSGKWRATKPGDDVRFPGVDLEGLRRELEGVGGSTTTTGGPVGGVGSGYGGGGGGHGVSGRGGSAMEQMVQDGSGTKRGAFLLDEVGKYINEFVMPPATPPPAPPPAQSAQVHLPVAGQTSNPAATKQDVGGVGEGVGVAGHAGLNGGGGGGGVSVEIAERQLAEARRINEEREGALRKVVRKNRKILGLG